MPLLLLMFASAGGRAQPSMNNSFMIGEERIYRDTKRSNLFYYIPFDYKLVTDASGKPSFTFNQMRYTGTRTGGDAGLQTYNNLLQFKVAMDISQQKKLADIKATLKTSNGTADLQMLPVRKFYSALVFAPSFATSGDTSSTIRAGVESTDEEATNNSYWNERTISVRLNNVDAELVLAALAKDQSAMSFSYAIYTMFVEKTSPDVVISGSSKLKKELADYFNQQSIATDTAHRITQIKSDAINLDVDIKRWPALVKKVDINERIPARYALFDVYCYDFNNDLRADLFEKKIEIKAESVGGTAITTAYSFRKSRPDVYARSIRFAYAVKLDKSFYYRVTEVNNDGDAAAGEWIERKEWSQVLDITSPPEKVVRPPVTEDQ